MTYKLYKHPAYGHVYGETEATPVGRLVWPSLLKPKDPPTPTAGQGAGVARFEISILLPKNNPKTDAFLEKIQKMTLAMVDLFNKGKPTKISIDKYMGDGDTFDAEKYPYYKDHYVLIARNVKAVGTVNADKKGIDTALIKGGVQGKLLVTPMVTSHGVSYKLELVQLINDDGTRFGGGTRDMLSLLDSLEEDSPAEAKAPAEAEAKPQPAAKTQSQLKTALQKL